MNTMPKLTIMLAGAGMLATAASARTLKAEVPFDFQAGTEHLPAGQYELRRMPSTSGTATYALTGASRTVTVVAESSLAASLVAAAPRLMFACTDNASGVRQVRVN
jgi:hypothetical protein